MLSEELVKAVSTATGKGNFSVSKPTTYRAEFYYQDRLVASVYLTYSSLIINSPFDEAIIDEFCREFSVKPYSYDIRFEDLKNASVLKFRNYIRIDDDGKHINQFMSGEDELFINGKERISRLTIDAVMNPFYKQLYFDYRMYPVDAIFPHYEKCLVVSSNNLYQLIKNYSPSEILCVVHNEPNTFDLKITKKLCELIIEEFPIKQIIFVDGIDSYCVVDLTGEEYSFEILKYKSGSVYEYLSKYFKHQLPKPKPKYGLIARG